MAFLLSVTEIVLFVYILALSAGIAIYLGFFAFDASTASRMVGSYGYVSIFLLSVCAFFSLCKLFIDNKVRCFKSLGQRLGLTEIIVSEHRKSVLKHLGYPALFVVLISLLVHWSQPNELKIMLDECVLAATSMEMHYERQSNAVMQGFKLDGVMSLGHGIVDKRPLFFPFLLSLLHDLTGYRHDQGLVLNALLTPIFLGLNFWIAYRFLNIFAGYMVVLLWVTVPLFSIVATSGSFDLLNITMILVSLIATYYYLQSPTYTRMNCMLIACLLLAQTRYESVLFIIPVGLSLLYVWWRERSIRGTKMLLATPLFLVVYAWQRIVMNNEPSYWQLEDTQSAVAFSFGFIDKNLRHAFDFFFSINGDQPNSIFLSLMFVFALLYLVVRILRRSSAVVVEREATIVFVGYGAVCLLGICILMTYHWGQLDDIVASRLALPFIMLQVFVVVLALRALSSSCNQMNYAALVVVSLYLCIFTRPTLASIDYQRFSTTQAQQMFLVDVLKDYEQENPMVIAQPHLAAITSNHTAVFPQVAFKQLARIDLHMRLKSFSDYFVVYLVPTQLAYELGDETFLEARELKASYETAFELETMQESKLSELCYIRFARIKGVKITDADRIELGSGIAEVSVTGRPKYTDDEVLSAFLKFLPR